MNPQKPLKPQWPGTRAALLRLLWITLILFPISWACYAFLVKSWTPMDGTEESARHFMGWMITLAGAIAVTFLASLTAKFSWLLKWRIKRRFLIAFAWLATIIALFYGVENWRGRRAWTNYSRQLEAQGEVLDFRAYLPKPVPEEQNFAATPFIKSWFARTTNATDGAATYSFNWEDNFSRADQMVGRSSNKTERTFIDLVAWQNAFAAVEAGETNSSKEFPSEIRDRNSREQAAPQVLEGMKSTMATLEELRAASARSYSQYPINYTMDNPWGILLPHLARVKVACRRLSLQACAELATGKSEEALENIKLILFMADSIKDEPILISYLVRLACIQVATQPVWEGLAEHRWSDAQLQKLQTQFVSYNFFQDLKPPFDAERAMGILTGDLIRKDKNLIDVLGMINDVESPYLSSPKIWVWLARLAPRGWFYQEQLNYLRLFQKQIEGAFDPIKKKISPTQIRENQKMLEREIAGGRLGRALNSVLRHRLIASMMLPALHKLPIKAANAQSVADYVTLACALERYRLAEGQFPEELTALVPKFISELPQDIFANEPYKYRRTEDGSFTLSSIGKNEKDDGRFLGVRFFDEANDWVWQYPKRN